MDKQFYTIQRLLACNSHMVSDDLMENEMALSPEGNGYFESLC